MGNMSIMPKAVVFSCSGGHQGDISVVRALGREGVPVTVVSEYKDSLALISRYCKETIYVNNLTADYTKALDCLVGYAKKQTMKPLLFPTADPDLKIMSDLREELEKHYFLLIPNRDILGNCMDKRKFFDMAKKYKFTIPLTLLPNDLDDILSLSKKISYPAIIKPAVPSSWNQRAIQEIVNEKKAIIVPSSDELVALYTKIAAYNKEMIIQEYIVGSDDNHHDLHVYMNKNSEPIAVFTGIKTRIYPAYAGTGCFVESIYIEDLAKQGIRMLKQVNFTGLANINYKKDSISKEYKLLEINPRISSWNILDSQCGVNLPFIAYADTVGIPFTPPERQKENVKYVFVKSDLKAFLEYRKNGDWTLWSWLRSLRGKKVYQMYASDDLKPFIVDLTKTMTILVQRIFR